MSLQVSLNEPPFLFVVFENTDYFQQETFSIMQGHTLQL